MAGEADTTGSQVALSSGPKTVDDADHTESCKWIYTTAGDRDISATDDACTSETGSNQSNIGEEDWEDHDEYVPSSEYSSEEDSDTWDMDTDNSASVTSSHSSINPDPYAQYYIYRIDEDEDSWLWTNADEAVRTSHGDSIEPLE